MDPEKNTQTHKVKAKLQKPKTNDIASYKKHIHYLLTIISIIFVFALVITFVIGGYYKTEALRNKVKDQRAEINEYQKYVETVEMQLENVSGSLADQQNLLTGKTKDIDNYNAKAVEMDSKIKSLESELDDLQDDYDSALAERDKYLSDKEDLLDVVKRSVKAVCCSFGDVQQGSNIDWQISGNQIMCGSGSHTVDCTSGETDFHE